MQITTDHYSLEFIPRARKIRTKITGNTSKDTERIHNILDQAQVRCSIEEQSIIGVHEKHGVVMEKLQRLISSTSAEASPEHALAVRLCGDIQFRAMLG